MVGDCDSLISINNGYLMLLVFGAALSLISFFLGLVGLVSADSSWSFDSVNYFWTMAILNHPILIILSSVCFSLLICRRKVESWLENFEE